MSGIPKIYMDWLDIVKDLVLLVEPHAACPSKCCDCSCIISLCFLFCVTIFIVSAVYLIFKLTNYDNSQLSSSKHMYQ